MVDLAATTFQNKTVGPEHSSEDEVKASEGLEQFLINETTPQSLGKPAFPEGTLQALSCLPLSPHSQLSCFSL